MANKASKLDNCGPPRVTIPDAPTLSELRGMPTDRPDILILEHPAAAQSDRSVLSRTLYTKQSVEANSLVTRPCQRRVTFRGCRHCFGEFSPPHRGTEMLTHLLATIKSCDVLTPWRGQGSNVGTAKMALASAMVPCVGNLLATRQTSPGHEKTWGSLVFFYPRAGLTRPNFRPLHGRIFCPPLDEGKNTERMTCTNL